MLKKPYIMNYAEEIFIETNYSSEKNDLTRSTYTIETSDVDEMHLGTTTITSTAEESDPDEICCSANFGTTLETRTIENSDPDELYFDDVILN